MRTRRRFLIVQMVCCALWALTGSGTVLGHAARSISYGFEYSAVASGAAVTKSIDSDYSIVGIITTEGLADVAVEGGAYTITPLTGGLYDSDSSIDTWMLY